MARTVGGTAGRPANGVGAARPSTLEGASAVHVRFWRREPVPPPPRAPRQRAGWEATPTQVLPTMGPGRAGNLTPAQRWRAGGWRRNDGPSPGGRRGTCA